MHYFFFNIVVSLLCENACAPTDSNPQNTSFYTGIICCVSPLCWHMCELKLLFFGDIRSQKTHCKDFPQGGYFCGPSDHLPWVISIHILCIYFVFTVTWYFRLLQIASKNVSNVHCFIFFPLCFILCVIRLSPSNEIKLHLIFSLM